jgi:hypothetical protein
MNDQPADIDPKQFSTAAPKVSKRSLKSEATKNYNANYILPKKKPFKRYIFGGILILILLLIGLLSIPPYGTVRYGLCKTFVELNDPYPQFLEWVSAQEKGMAVIIDYNRTDAFGQRTLNQIRCFFKEDEKKGLMLERININGDNEFPQEGKEYIDRFNIGIPALLKTQPSLVMPRGQTGDVKDYR